MIKAVLLDYEGTLANTMIPWDTVSERIAARLDFADIRADPVDLENAIMDTINFRDEQNQQGVELNSYEFFNYALGILGNSVNLDITDELDQYVYEESYTEFVTSLDEILMELSNCYKLALLSNTWLEAPRQVLRDNGYNRWFDVMLCSFDIGISKPDKRIFEFALELLGVPAYETVMVGDSLELDIKGAFAVGMKAILVDDGFSDWSGPKILELDELKEVLIKLGKM